MNNWLSMPNQADINRLKKYKEFFIVDTESVPDFWYGKMKSTSCIIYVTRKTPMGELQANEFEVNVGERFGYTENTAESCGIALNTILGWLIGLFQNEASYHIISLNSYRDISTGVWVFYNVKCGTTLYDCVHRSEIKHYISELDILRIRNQYQKYKHIDDMVFDKLFYSWLDGEYQSDSSCASLVSFLSDNLGHIYNSDVLIAYAHYLYVIGTLSGKGTKVGIEDMLSLADKQLLLNLSETDECQLDSEIWGLPLSMNVSLWETVDSIREWLKKEREKDG